MLQAEQNKKVLVGWGKVLQVIDQVDIINHKTGNNIQILSRQDADTIAKLTRRRGYGTYLR